MPLSVNLHFKTLLEHLLITAGTGSGKTSMVLNPIHAQVAYHMAKRGGLSLCILDMKGDPFGFHYLRRLAKELGIPFKFFTTKKGYTSFGMNPWQQRHFRELTINQKAEMLTKALGLDEGDGYGRSFFRSMATMALRGFVSFDEIDSIASVAAYAKNHRELAGLPKWLDGEAKHLHAELDALAAIETINGTPAWTSDEFLENSIDLNDLFDTPQIVYFYLQPVLEDQICATIARFVAYLLLTAAASRDGGSPNQVLMSIDEFHRVCSQDFRIFLQQARGFNIGCLLATQSVGDMTQIEQDFTQVIRDNVNTEIALTKFSGASKVQAAQESADVKGYALTHTDDGLTVQETVEKQLSQNDWTEITSSPHHGTIRTAMPYGLTQCRGYEHVFRLDYTVTYEQYCELFNASWPTQDECPGTITVTGKANELYLDDLLKPSPKAHQGKKTVAALPFLDDSHRANKAMQPIYRDPISPESK